jgi:prephenate dehydrogenase
MRDSESLGTVAIKGVGLIGGSIGLTLRARGLATRVVGLGRDESKLRRAVELGAIDEFTTDPASAYSRADCVVVCTPVGSIVEDVLECFKYSRSQTMVTDAGSVKGTIVSGVLGSAGRDAERFVGAHPIAGSERGGVEFSRGDLFENRVCVLTPTDPVCKDSLQRARAFWQGLGCSIVETTPERHDELLASGSHLPHVIAAALAASIPIEAIPLTAGAFRDGTRVAASSAELWTGIFQANREPLLQAIARYEAELTSFVRALESNQEVEIKNWWLRAQQRLSTSRAESNPTINVDA